MNQDLKRNLQFRNLCLLWTIWTTCWTHTPRNFDWLYDVTVVHRKSVVRRGTDLELTLDGCPEYGTRRRDIRLNTEQPVTALLQHQWFPSWLTVILELHDLDFTTWIDTRWIKELYVNLVLLTEL